MSIKIWEAYRFPKGMIIKFLDIVRESSWPKYMDKIRILLMAVVTEEEVAAQKKEKVSWYSEKLESIKPPLLEEVEFRWKVLEPKLKEASTKFVSLYYDVDSGWNVWFKGKYCYVMPVGQNYAQFSEDWIEEYHYQNQTDRPKDISPERWAQRLRNWNQICLGENEADHNARRLYYQVIGFSPPGSASGFDTEIALGFYHPKVWAEQEAFWAKWVKENKIKIKTVKEYFEEARGEQGEVVAVE